MLRRIYVNAAVELPIGGPALVGLPNLAGFPEPVGDGGSDQ